MSFEIHLRSATAPKKDEGHPFGISYWYLPGGFDAANARAQTAWFSSEEERDQFVEKYKDVSPYNVCKV